MDASATFRFPGLADLSDPSSRVTDSSQGTEASSPVSDETLALQVGNGSEEALTILFRRYARIVRGVAYKVLRDTSEADDLLQDIFLLIYRVAATFDPSRASAKTWILQMTYRRAISRRRALTSRHFYNRVDLEEIDGVVGIAQTADEGTPASLNRLIGQDIMQKSVEELSENQRETLRLFFYEGYTLAEIAEKLGQSSGNVSNHYYRALEKLRRRVFGVTLAGK